MKKELNPVIWKTVTLLFICIISLNNLSGQKTKAKIPTQTMSQPATATSATVYVAADTTPIRKAILKDQIRVNNDLYLKYNRVSTVDTVLDLGPFLQAKAGCDFERAFDDNGCVLVRYTDGFTKKICNGRVTEVITTDGRKHVSRFGNMNIKMYVIPVPAPANPSGSDNSYQWLVAYNQDLLDEISGLFGDSKAMIKKFSDNEQLKCKGNIYLEIQFRTILIGDFLKAK
jgi:hypothetical protein